MFNGTAVAAKVEDHIASVIGAVTVYTTIAGVALAAFASASSKVRTIVSKHTVAAVSFHLVAAALLIAAQVPLCAELVRRAQEDADAELRLVSAGLGYAGVSMLFSVFLVYTPSVKRTVTADSGGTTVRMGRVEIRVGFSRGSLREFLAQFLSPLAKRVCMTLYVFVFAAQGLSAWSLQRAVEIVYSDLPDQQLSDDEILLLRVSVAAIYVIVCLIFLIAFFTPMADAPENARFLVQRGFAALLSLKKGPASADEDAPADDDGELGLLLGFGSVEPPQSSAEQQAEAIAHAFQEAASDVARAVGFRATHDDAQLPVPSVLRAQPSSLHCVCYRSAYAVMPSWRSSAASASW